MADNKVKPSYYVQLRTDDETGGRKWELRGIQNRSEGDQK